MTRGCGVEGSRTRWTKTLPPRMSPHTERTSVTPRTSLIYEGPNTGTLVAAGFFDLSSFHGDAIIGGRLCKNE